MKRIGYLFDRVVDPENLRLAFLKASRGKRLRDDHRSFAADLDGSLRILREGLIGGWYPVGDYHVFKIYDPKEREICAASFGERVLQHALMNVCEPYFDRWLVYDSYACRAGKGQLKAVQRARSYAARYPWFIKCDFRKYFDSIPQNGVRRMLARRFKDPFLLGWFDRILSSYEKSPGRGLPIGNLTSQHFANLYLDPLDRFRPGTPYVRYMDDFIFWGEDRARLITLRKDLSAFIETLGLQFKQEPFINRTAQGMDFLGLRVFPSSLKLSRASRLRYARKVAFYERSYEKGVLDEQELQARVTALTAFTDQVDAVHWRRHHWVLREERREATVSTAAGAGTTMRANVAPRTATGGLLAMRTTTTASASLAPQHRRIRNRVVPAEDLFPATGQICTAGAVSRTIENFLGHFSPDERRG